MSGLALRILVRMVEKSEKSVTVLTRDGQIRADIDDVELAAPAAGITVDLVLEVLDDALRNDRLTQTRLVSHQEPLGP